MARNAVSSAGIRTAARVPEAVAANSLDFDLEVTQGKRTDQMRSGRCWMFAALNTMRYRVIKKYNLKTFELSQAYPLFFDKLEKISGSWIPVVDTSGSMLDSNDSFGKALSIGHYLAKCSTYAPNKVISFSSRPQLIELGVDKPKASYWGYSRSIRQEYSQYAKEINSMYTGDCSNTDFGAVMRMLQQLDRENAPEYIVVLSDMEFDYGSSMSKDATMALFRQNNFPTKIVWWNFNSRATTCPETDAYGNIFISGYNPMLLNFLEAGFNANTFLDKLLSEYQKYLEKQVAVA
jgi:hypothetical protein